jgi:hypothetical protein
MERNTNGKHKEEKISQKSCAKKDKELNLEEVQT